MPTSEMACYGKDMRPARKLYAFRFLALAGLMLFGGFVSGKESEDEPRIVDQATKGRQGIAEWEPKAREFEAGKRSERDGYIILTRLASFYGIRKSHGGLSSPEQARLISIKEKIAEIVGRHPDWPSMSDRRLSEELAADAQKQASKERETKAAQQFIPKDRRPLTFLNDAQNLVAKFWYRIEFYSLRDIARVDNQGGAISLVSSGGEEVEWRKLPPQGVMTFKRNFYLRSSKQVNRFIVCTNALHSWYSADSPEERETISRHPSQSNWSIPWVSETGEHKDFCGVLDFAGRILFKFPVRQVPTGDILKPLAVRPDGAAAVLLGQASPRDWGSGGPDVPGRFREMLVWDSAKGLVRTQLDPKTSNEVELRIAFLKNDY